MKNIPAILAALACLYVAGVRAETAVPAEKSKFHLFVLAGSILHFLCILFYVM